MARQARSLHGRVAAVTGGGRGIGKAIASALAGEGARVAIGDVDAASAEAAAGELGGDAIGLALDVTDRPGFTAFLDRVEQRLGPIDILVNNAGIMAVGPFEAEDDATAVRMVEINLQGVIHGTKEAVRRMKPRGTGHIVNMASSAGRFGFPNLSTYCATKYGVIGLSEAVSAELRRTGVEITVVMPNFVRTELSAGMGEVAGFRHSTVDDVAQATLHALRFPRFDVFVPKKIGAMWALSGLLPRRARDTTYRALRIDKALLEYDRAARAAYEARAAASAPAVEEDEEDAKAAQAQA